MIEYVGDGYAQQVTDGSVYISVPCARIGEVEKDGKKINVILELSERDADNLWVAIGRLITYLNAEREAQTKRKQELAEIEDKEICYA